MYAAFEALNFWGFVWIIKCNSLFWHSIAIYQPVYDVKGIVWIHKLIIILAINVTKVENLH